MRKHVMGLLCGLTVLSAHAGTDPSVDRGDIIIINATKNTINIQYQLCTCNDTQGCCSTGHTCGSVQSTSIGTSPVHHVMLKPPYMSDVIILSAKEINSSGSVVSQSNYQERLQGISTCEVTNWGCDFKGNQNTHGVIVLNDANQSPIITCDDYDLPMS